MSCSLSAVPSCAPTHVSLRLRVPSFPYIYRFSLSPSVSPCFTLYCAVVFKAPPCRVCGQELLPEQCGSQIPYKTIFLQSRFVRAPNLNPCCEALANVYCFAFFFLIIILSCSSLLFPFSCLSFSVSFIRVPYLHISLFDLLLAIGSVVFILGIVRLLCDQGWTLCCDQSTTYFSCLVSVRPHCCLPLPGALGASLTAVETRR